MAMVLQQALRGLCYKSGWSYAVFWKLKRRSRMVLTWEDGFYEFPKSSAASSFDSMQSTAGYHMMNSVGRPGTGADAPVPDVPSSEDEIGLAVARMSYHVYSLGEGIIGRVAFTGKHQWVFGERGSTGEGNASGRSGRAINEKYPAGWQQQFTAGIKTIAVVAVPQGVVQLGSTQIVMEDLTLVSHVRTLFGTLQSVPGAFLSDYVPESQGGRLAAPCSMVMPMPMMMQMGAVNDSTRNISLGHMHPAQLNISNMSQVPTTVVGSGSFDMMSLCKPAIPVRAHLNNPFLPSPINPLNPLSLQTSRIMPGPLMNKDLPARNQSLLSTVSMAVGNRQGLLNIPFTAVCPQASKPTAPSVVSSDRHSVSPVVPRNWNSPTTIPSVGQSKVGNLFDQTKQADQGMHHQLQTNSNVSGVNACHDTLTSASLRSTSTSVTSASATKVGCSEPKPSQTYVPVESCRTESLRESSFKAGEYRDSVVDIKSPRGQSQLYSRSSVEVQIGQSRRSSPSVEKSNVDLAFRSPSLKVPTEGLMSHSGKWPHTVIHQISQAESFDVSRNCTSGVDQFVDNRNTAAYCRTGEHEEVCKKAFVQSSQKFGDVTGFPNSLVSLSKVVGSSIQDTEKSSEGGRSVDVPSESASRVWNENHKTDWDCFSSLLNPFPIGDELSQALRPVSSRDGDRDFFSNVRPYEVSSDKHSNSDVQTAGDVKLSADSGGEGKDVHNLAMDYDIFKAVSDAVLMDSRSEPLLEAMVARVSSVPLGPSAPSPSKVDSSSYEATPSGCTSALTGEPESLLHRNESYGRGSSGDTLDYDTSTKASPCKGDAEWGKLSGCGIDSQRESIHKVNQNPTGISGDEGHRRSEEELGPYDSLLPAKRPEESGKGGNSRKKAKHGDALRPRPKDRQQIQDRVRELREIVPNACKCSIDALLERTIKHMHFLQSVTQHGGKWKQFEDLKEEDAEFPVDDLGDCSHPQGVNEKLEGGANFALKFGKLNSGCPIVVENLNQPRQMLVEMLCEERGLFLEIADTVRGLGLTILKGAMESRSGKTWARFVVEAGSRDIHRVEVLWNLMQLLQPTCALQPGSDRPPYYTDANCLYGGALDSTSSSFSSSFPHMLQPSVSLQMTAR